MGAGNSATLDLSPHAAHPTFHDRIRPRCLDRSPDDPNTDVTLTDDVLDRIDEIVPPGTDVSVLDQAYQPPALVNPGLRRRLPDERAAA